MENTLTVKEALEQGYTHFFYDSDGYQSLKPIEPEEINWNRDDISLVEKEGYSPQGLCEDSLKEMIIDSIWSNHYDETQDDTSAILDALNEIKFDLTAINKQIDEALSKLTYYKSSGIRLIP